MILKKFIKKIVPKVRSIFSYIKKNYKILHVTQILNFIVSILMLWIDPIILFTYLLSYNLYLKHSKQYTLIDFLMSFIPILIFWYLVLMYGLTLFCPISIGPGDTEELILFITFYEPIEPSYCEHVCLNSIMLLDKLSCFLGYSIVIDFPNIGMFRIFK